MTAVAYVPPNVLPPMLQKFAGLLEAQVVSRTGARAADPHAPTLLQQDRRLRSLPALPRPEDRPTLDLCAGHRAQSKLVESGGAAPQPHLRGRAASLQAGLADPLLLHERPEHEECLVLVEERDPTASSRSRPA